MDIQETLQALTKSAVELGATAAAAVSTVDIPVEDDLAAMCLTPGCRNYGLSAGCPPHVAGPSGFRILLKHYSHAIAFKIEVPEKALFSIEQSDYFRRLHEIAAGIEHRAVELGLRRSSAFAGGSCKQLFCADHAACRVVAGGGTCRNPLRARPSMSGFGVNVSKLMQAAGWPMNRPASETDPGAASTGTLAGVVLIG
jgi:predicted metal-binding protein